MDLSDVDSVDVTALRVLASVTRLAAREDRRVVLRGCRPGIRRLLHRAHLIRFVELERDPALI